MTMNVKLALNVAQIARHISVLVQISIAVVNQLMEINNFALQKIHAKKMKETVTMTMSVKRALNVELIIVRPILASLQLQV